MPSSKKLQLPARQLIRIVSRMCSGSFEQAAGVIQHLGLIVRIARTQEVR
jgi:hypothetical protein